MAGDVVWLDVLPAMGKFGPTLTSEATKASQAAGKSSGGAWSQAFEQAAGDGGAKKIAAELEAAEKKAERAVTAATANIGKARASQREAAARVVLAEEKYEAAVRKGGEESAQAQAASLRLEAAREKEKVAADKVAQAEDTLVAGKRELREITQQLEQATARANDEASESVGAWDRAADSIDEAGDEVRRFADDLDNIDGEGAGKKAGKGFRDSFLGSFAGNVAANAFSALTGSVKALWNEAVVASDATDKFKSTLDFAGLDTTVIDRLTKSTQKYADDTVYDLDDIQSITAQLASNGVENYDRLAEAAGNLNTVAGGNVETYSSVGMVLTQTAGAQKLTTENWNQLANAIPGASGKLQDALLKAGAYTGNFRDAMAEGQITADEFNAAIMDLGFEDAAVEAATSVTTIEGSTGNLQATVVGGMKDMIDKFKPQVTAGIGVISDVVGKFFTGLQASIEWVGANSDWISAIAVGIGAVAGAWGAWTLAVKTWQTAVTVGKVAMAAFNAVMAVNPIILVVAAVAALAAGLTYFFTKTETGKRLWGQFTAAIGGAWDWLSTKLSAVWAWIQANVIDKFVGAWRWASEKVTDTVVKIVVGWQWLSTQFSVGWQWIKTNVIDRFVAGWQWVSDRFTVVKAYVQVAWGAWQYMLKSGWDWINTNVIQRFVAGWQWVSDRFAATKNVLISVWTLTRTALKSGWDWIYANVIQRFVAGWNWVSDRFAATKNALINAWTLTRNGLKSGWDWINEKVFSPLKAGVAAIGTAFDRAQAAIGGAWGKIKAAAAKPVNFVLQTVYMEGIRKWVLGVADKLGISLKLPEAKRITGFAAGGMVGDVLPGYSPGVDNYSFYNPTLGRLDLSGGEGILVPEAVRGLGAGFVGWANRFFSGGRSDGGVGTPQASGSHSHAYAGGGIVGWFKDKAKGIGDFLADPLAAVTSLIMKPVNALIDRVAGAGIWKDVAVGSARKILGGVPEFFKRKSEKITPPGGAVPGAGAPGGGPAGSFNPIGWQRMVAIIKAAFPGAYITSTYRPGSGLSMHGKGRAIDIASGNMMQIAEWLLKNYPNSYQVLHSPLGARNIWWAGQRGFPPGYLYSTHFDHVHWAMREGGLVPDLADIGVASEHMLWGLLGAMAGKRTGPHREYEPGLEDVLGGPVRHATYDAGGPLLPGYTLAYNGTGRAEMVRTADQEAALHSTPSPQFPREIVLVDRDGSLIARMEAIADDAVGDLDDARFTSRLGVSA